MNTIFRIIWKRYQDIEEHNMIYLRHTKINYKIIIIMFVYVDYIVANTMRYLYIFFRFS